MKIFNHIPFFLFLNLKACKEPSVSSTLIVRRNISDDVNREVSRQSSARVRGVDKYQGKGVLKVSKKGKSEVEG